MEIADHVRRLFEDPNRPMGVREYRPEDGFRRVHWPATARTGQLQVKVYQPTTGQVMMVCMNVSTFTRHWEGIYPELLEHLIKVAATIVDEGIREGYKVGLVANGCLAHADQPFRIPPGRSPQQLAVLLQALAGVTSVVTGNFDRFLLREIPRIQYGATLIILTSVTSPELASTLIQLKQHERTYYIIFIGRRGSTEIPGIQTIHQPFHETVKHMKTFSSIRLNPWREIAILMIILMEVSWITPWFRSLTPETYAVNSLRVLIILAIIVLGSHLFVRIMDYLHLKKSIRQGLIVIIVILSSIIGIKTLVYTHETDSLSAFLSQPIRSFLDIQSIIPIEFIVIVAIMIGFWRGISLAQQPIGPSLVKSHFLLGIVMFIAFIFLITLATGENPGEFFYIFLFTSLVGVSAARMTVVGMMRGGRENRFNRSWFLGIIFAALVVVGLSSLLGGILSEKFGWIGGLFIGLFGSILVLVWLIFSPVISYLDLIAG